MNIRMFSKALAVAVIILFIGLTIQPSVAIESETEKDAEPKLNIYKGLLMNLRGLINIIKMGCNQEPGIVESSQEVIDVINTLILKDIFCSSLMLLWGPLWALLWNLGYVGRVILGTLVFIPFYIFYSIWEKFCFKQPDGDYETISIIPMNLIEMQDNIIECPCMEE